MEQKVRVTKINEDGTARVIHIRESACSGDCHKCSGCGAAKETLVLDAMNPIGAQPGDLVRIESESGPVLLGAAILYGLPLVLFFLGYYLGEVLLQMGPLGSGLGFVLGVCLVIGYDRIFAKKNKTVYTIVGYVHK